MISKVNSVEKKTKKASTSLEFQSAKHFQKQRILIFVKTMNLKGLDKMVST